MGKIQITNSALKVEKVSLRNRHLNDEKFQIKPILEKEIVKESENKYTIYLSLSFKNLEASPFPIDLTVVFSNMYEFSKVKDDNDILNFLNINAIQIVFPYMRTLVSSLTASALMQPLMLPIINVKDFKHSKIKDKL